MSVKSAQLTFLRSLTCPVMIAITYILMTRRTAQKRKQEKTSFLIMTARAGRAGAHRELRRWCVSLRECTHSEAGQGMWRAFSGLGRASIHPPPNHKRKCFTHVSLNFQNEQGEPPSSHYYPPPEIDCETFSTTASVFFCLFFLVLLINCKLVFYILTSFATVLIEYEQQNKNYGWT